MFIEHVEDFDNKMVEFFEYVLEIPEDLIISDRAGVIPYHRAVYNSNPNLVRYLFVEQGTDPNIRDNTIFGMTPMLSSLIYKSAFKMISIIRNEGNGDLEIKTLYSQLSAT